MAVAAISASAETKIWTGLGADAKASTADNWQAPEGASPAAPVAGDAIVFGATGRDHPCTWDLDIPLASWTQDGYTNVVTIQTVYDANGFDCLEITGDVLLNSGVWNHKGNSNAETYRLRVNVGGDMTIGQDASINLTKKGYAPGKGPGSPGSTKQGAAHGGQSSDSSSRCYGSITAPVNLGSGGSSANNREPYGGGALRLTVAGSLSHNGVIEADGRTYLASGALATYYGGAGGSVWITAGSMIGAGSISASSGRQSQSYYGGGGRISLILTDANADFSGFIGEVKATSSYNGGYKAASGTVYYETAADGAGHGVVKVDGYSTSGSTYTDIILDDQDVGFAPRRIELGNNARLRITSGTRTALTVAEGIFGFGSGSRSVRVASGATLSNPGGTLTFDMAELALPSGGEVSCEHLAMTNGASVFVSGEATIDAALVEFASGCTMTDDTPLSVTGSVVLRNGATVTHSANSSITDNRIQMNIGGSLTVESGAKIDTVGKGYPKEVGPGAGVAASGGANHGGRGLGSKGAPNANVCYGSITRPTEIGSGIYRYEGSGAIKIVCQGPVTNNGVITSCGYYSNVSYSSPGGSVWLTGASLVGSGYIQANALGDSTKKDRNNTQGTTNRSGGGRVAVWLTEPGADFSDFSGVISAWGCGNTSMLGGAGTVYLKTGDQAENEGTLIIDNRYNATTIGATEIGEDVTEANVGSVIIGLGSRLLVKEGQTLTVNGDFAITNAAGGSFVAEDGAAVVFAGRAPALISGNITAENFICETPGKSISFAPGSTLSVSGLLKAEGEAGRPVTLGCSDANGSWNLVLGNDVAQQMTQVSVSRSDASGGAEAVAINSSDLGGNVNWRFENISAGETNIWTGAASDAWALADNWDLGRAPLATDFVIVPGAPTNQPALSTDSACASISIAAGATVSLNGNNFTVTGDATVAGSIVAEASETISVGGDFDISAGTFVCARSTVVLNGSSEQTFDSGQTAFHAVSIANGSAAGVTLSGSPSCKTFSFTPATMSAINFAGNASLTVAISLTLAGASAEAPLVLAPEDGSGKWEIHSQGLAFVSNVAVSNSTATASTIFASSSTDLGGNTNWIFNDDPTTVWTGNVDTDFANAANWSAGVPDATKIAVLGAGADVALSAPASVRALVVGCGFTANAALTVAESLVVRDGAMVVLNKPVSVGKSAILESGATMTHGTTTSAAGISVDLDIGEDLVIEPDAAIDVSGLSGANLGPNGSSRGGGAHGGRSSNSTTGFKGCYGSVCCPTNSGSSSVYDTPLKGGGIVRLRVAGKTIVDGAIRADGQKRNVSYYSGSGGSVWISSGCLLGAGSISANGGVGGGGYYTGAGGRIAINLSEASSVGPDLAITAYSGYAYASSTHVPTGSPGTIYVETSSDEQLHGNVLVANHPGASVNNQFVDYPSTRLAASDDGQYAVWRLSGAVTLYLTRDAELPNIFLEGSKPRIQLNGHTLRVNAPHHRLGTDEAVQIIPGGTEENPGQIIWSVRPTVLMLL